jgi:hypothetical protein
MNGSTPVDVLPAAQDFQLVYDKTVIREEYTPPASGDVGPEAGPVVARNYENYTGISNSGLQNNKWTGQYFMPVLPADAVAWRITSIQLRLKQDNAGQAYHVRLRQPDGSNLPGTLIESVPANSSDLPAEFAWVTFAFTTNIGLDPTQGVCITLETSGDRPCKYEFRNGGVSEPNSARVEGNGIVWDKYKPDKAMLYRAHGMWTSTVASATTPAIDREHIRSIDVTLQGDGSTDMKRQTTVRMLNMPEVLSAVWDLDFRGDPLKVDLDGNGYDWQLRGGGTIPAEHLVNGVWQMDGGTAWQLDTHPTSTFSTEPITVEMRYRCPELSNHGGYLWFNADYTDGRFMPIIVELDKISSTTQELTIYSAAGGPTFLTRSNLSTDFVDVRLLIDPIADMINIRVNGADHGTQYYTRRIPAGDPQRATLSHWGSDMEFDYVRIRVGGTTP